MSFIRIFHEEQELEFVKQSLTIRKENNALISNFKVSHSSYPFLVVENKTTVNALGPRDITSVLKQKIIPVTVHELGEIYYGELQVLEFIKGFRKCNLKYATELLTIFNKPIKTYLPTVSVIPGETDPEPFVQEATEVIDGYEHWATYPFNFLSQIYPQVKWQFPTMFWQDRIEDISETPEWQTYNNELNRFFYNESENRTDFIENTFVLDGFDLTVTNKNIAAPQLFLLTPLFYALQNIGFKLAGNFSTNPFIRRLLLLSQEDNLTKVPLAPEGIVFTLGTVWDIGVFSGFGLYPRRYVESNNYVIELAGDYKIKYRVVMDGSYSPSTTFLLLAVAGTLNVVFSPSSFESDGTNWVTEGEHSFVINEDEIGLNIVALFFNQFNRYPLEHNIELIRKDSEFDFFEMHPTIETGRYCPTWTTGEYITQLKKTFNLDVTVDDFKKVLTLNFNEAIPDTEIPEILRKSLKINSFDSVAHTSFILKYANDEDTALIITRTTTDTDISLSDDFSSEISNKFKFVPMNGYTALLSEELKSKSGVGLMIYDPNNLPYISSSYNSQNLTLNETGGIYDTYWKKWLKFRLNASSVELSGPFTEVQVAKFNKAKSIYVDNQHYRIVSMSLKEASQNKINVKFTVESVNY